MPAPPMIAPEGELDLHSIASVVQQLDEVAGADEPHVILDLSGVTLLDSSALGGIIDVQHRFNGQRRRLSVIAPKGSAAVVMLELTGLKSAFSLFDSYDAALA